MHQHGLARTGLRLVMESAIRGGVRNADGRPLAERERGGQRLHGGDIAGGELGVPGGAQGPDPIAALELAHAVADRLDHPGAVAAGDVGERREHGVGSRADVGVDRIDTGSPDPHEHLARSRLGVGDLVELQDLGTAELVHADRLHALSSRSGGRPGAAGCSRPPRVPSYQTRSRGVVNRFVATVIVCAARSPPRDRGGDMASLDDRDPQATRPAPGPASARARGCSPFGLLTGLWAGVVLTGQGPRRAFRVWPSVRTSRRCSAGSGSSRWRGRSIFFATARAVSGAWPG